MTGTLKAVGELAFTVTLIVGWVAVNYLESLSPLTM